jgi:hypothetical protein
MTAELQHSAVSTQHSARETVFLEHQIYGTEEFMVRKSGPWIFGLAKKAKGLNADC